MGIKEHFKWIDIAKAIGIISVVYAHIFRNTASEIIYLFHMPLFFFLGGYLHRPKSNFKEYFKKKFNHLMVPFITYFVIIFLLLEIFLLDSTLKDYLLILYKGVGGWMSTFWFPICFFITQQIFNFVIIKNSSRSLLFLVSICLVLAYADDYLLNNIHDKLPWCLNVCLYSFVLYTIGFYFQQSTLMDKVRKIPLFIYIILLVALVFLPIKNFHFDMKNTEYGFPLITLMVSLTLTFFVFRVSELLIKYKNISGLLEAIGKASMVIMFVHPSLLILLGKLIASKALLFVVVLIASILLKYLFGFGKFSSFLLLGQEKSPRKAEAFAS